MAIRRETDVRFWRVKTCHVCGKEFMTTAASPFMRQLYNVGGKKQKTCYFCSEKCKMSTYKHLWDGKADERRKERYARRDISEKNKRYYAAHSERERERQRERWRSLSENERKAINAYNKAKMKITAGACSA